MIGIAKVLGFVKTVLSGGMGLIARYPLHALFLALLCLSGWLWHGKGEAQDQSALWQAAFTAQKKAYETAQEAASAEALAARQETERQYKDIAHEADVQHAAFAADYRARLSAYIATHGMRAEITDRPSGGTSAAHEDQAAPGSDAAGAETGMVGVSRRDLETLTDNTARLEAVREWGQRLIAEGLAE